MPFRALRLFQPGKASQPSFEREPLCGCLGLECCSLVIGNLNQCHRSPCSFQDRRNAALYHGRRLRRIARGFTFLGRGNSDNPHLSGSPNYCLELLGTDRAPFQVRGEDEENQRSRHQRCGDGRQ